MKTRAFTAAAVASLLTLAASACGSSSGSSTPNTVPADAGLIVKAGPGIRFDKSNYTATAGTVKVAYVNDDAQLHTLVLVAPDGTTLPGELEVNKSGAIDVGTYTLTPGTYKVLCRIPGHENMKATLTVN